MSHKLSLVFDINPKVIPQHKLLAISKLNNYIYVLIPYIGLFFHIHLTNSNNFIRFYSSIQPITYELLEF